MSTQTVNPVVYYTGNIWYKPGEIVTFSGHQLGEAVEKVELYRAAGSTGRCVGFLFFGSEI